MLHFMSDPDPIGTTRLEFLYTNIGRGHPFYLDGIAEALIRQGGISLVRRERDVFELSRGFSRVAWRAARWLYRSGSSGGPAGMVYGKLRRGVDHNNPGLLTRIMARDIRRKLLGTNDPLVVAHPSLVGMLAGRECLYYQHGEMVAPSESLVRGASCVFVPTDDVAAAFVSAGYERQSIFVSGLCIEPAIRRQAADSYAARIERIGSELPLTAGFFSSGAEPSPHVDVLADCALSALRNGHRVIIFARQNGKLSRAAVHAMHQSRRDFAVVDRSNIVHQPLPAAAVVEYSDRREQTALTARLFPQLDYFAGPAHERTNWAAGLGLPLFVVEPCIGPFAPLNRDLLLQLGVGAVIGRDCHAREFGSFVSELRERGHLQRMASSGWGVYPIDGFARIADLLIQRHDTAR